MELKNLAYQSGVFYYQAKILIKKEKALSLRELSAESIEMTCSGLPVFTLLSVNRVASAAGCCTKLPKSS